MNETFDVAIIGASIAGSSLALRLARLGLSVALFDKATFPRRKACGEGFSSIGVRALEELGLGAQLSLLPKQELSGYSIRAGRDTMELPFDSSSGESFGIERSHLDTMLLNAAADYSNVCVFQNSKVCGIERQLDVVKVVAAGGTLSARHLVLADGVNSILASKLKIPVRIDRRTRFGISMELKGVSFAEHNKIQIQLFTGFEVFCTPVSKSRLNFCILAQKKSMRFLSETEQLRKIKDRVLQEIGFSGEVAEPPISIGPIGHMIRQAHAEGVILVGDCCEHLDPIGGMGMSHALLSAKLAAEAIAALGSDKVANEKALQSYALARERMVRPMRGFTRLTYLSLVQGRESKVLTALRKSSLGLRLGAAAHSLGDTASSHSVPRMILTAAGI